MKNLNLNPFNKWTNNSFGSRKGNQKAAMTVRPELELTTLDVKWGLVPVYMEKVVRRRGDQLVVVAAKGIIRPLVEGVQV